MMILESIEERVKKLAFISRMMCMYIAFYLTLITTMTIMDYFKRIYLFEMYQRHEDTDQHPVLSFSYL